MKLLLYSYVVFLSFMEDKSKNTSFGGVFFFFSFNKPVIFLQTFESDTSVSFGLPALKVSETELCSLKLPRLYILLLRRPLVMFPLAS